MKTVQEKKKTYLQPLLRLMLINVDCLLASGGEDVETMWGDGNNWDKLYHNG